MSDHTHEQVLQRGDPIEPPGGRVGSSVGDLYDKLWAIYEARAEISAGSVPQPPWGMEKRDDGRGELVRTDSAEVRNDGWINTVTGAGGEGDRSQSNAYARPLDLAVQLAVALFYTDDFAAKIIEAHVDEALRLTVRVKAPIGTDEEVRQRVQDRLDGLGWAEAAKQGATFARALGDAWVFPCVEGDQTGSITKGSRVIAFKNFDRRDLIPYRWDLDPLSPRYGEPDDYQIVAIWGSPQAAYVNHSRLIHFEGVHVDVWERLANGGYNHSVLQRALPVIRAVQQAWDGVVYLLGEASLKVLSVNGLPSKLAQARQMTIARAALINQTAANNNMAVIDGGADAGEKLERLEVGALAGLASTLEVLMGRLASVANMPMAILFRQAPAGLNAAVSGDVSTRAWYASVGAVQTHKLRPQMTVMVQLVADELAPGTSGWGVEFPSLWDVSSTEKIDNRGKVATSLVALVGAAILTPEEAAIELAQGDFEMDFISLGLDARKRLVEGQYDPTPQPTPTKGAVAAPIVAPPAVTPAAHPAAPSPPAG